MACRNARGFTLIEVLVAAGVLAVALAGIAPLVVMAQRAEDVARTATVAQQAARAKLEQLRALAWTSDAGAVPITDWTADLSTTPQGNGGAGLADSGVGTLTSNRAGYCDFLDAGGAWLAGGVRPPGGTAWIRRWSVVPLAEVPDTLVLQVVVIPLATSGPEASLRSARALNGAWLVDMRTRGAR